MDKVRSTNRRVFLKVAGAAGAIAAIPATAEAQTGSTPSAVQNVPSPAPGYQSLGLEEAAFTESMVDHMWPADELTPSGTGLGIVVFVDRQLAGSFGRGDRLYMQGPFRKGKPQHGYQLPMTPEQFYKAGVVACNNACVKRFDKRTFDRLSGSEREAFLQDVAAGRIQEPGLSLQEWFNGLVYPLFVQGAFADPIYGGNGDKSAWRMIGYPGLPAVYNQDIVRYRGKPHPRSKDPRSIQDLS